MNEFILQLVLFLSLGTVIYMIARAVPRIDDDPEALRTFGRFFGNLPVHKFDAALTSLAEKNLRKIRVVLLRVDNGVSGYLNRMKSNGANPAGRSLFEEYKAEEEEVVS